VYPPHLFCDKGQVLNNLPQTDRQCKPEELVGQSIHMFLWLEQHQARLQRRELGAISTELTVNSAHQEHSAEPLVTFRTSLRVSFHQGAGITTA
jgi:hypothetical protein